MYGVAHATGVGNQAIPLIHAAGQGLIRLSEGKEYLQNVGHSIVG